LEFLIEKKDQIAQVWNSCVQHILYVFHFFGLPY
jgi:hypothetical protein